MRGLDNWITGNCGDDHPDNQLCPECGQDGDHHCPKCKTCNDGEICHDCEHTCEYCDEVVDEIRTLDWTDRNGRKCVDRMCVKCWDLNGYGLED